MLPRKEDRKQADADLAQDEAAGSGVDIFISEPLLEFCVCILKGLLALAGEKQQTGCVSVSVAAIDARTRIGHTEHMPLVFWAVEPHPGLSTGFRFRLLRGDTVKTRGWGQGRVRALQDNFEIELQRERFRSCQTRFGFLSQSVLFCSETFVCGAHTQFTTLFSPFCEVCF